jgi:hypothetical protein
MEDFEGRIETNLESEVTKNQAILNAYQKLQDSDLDSLARTSELNLKGLSLKLENISLIQRNWRFFQCRKSLKVLRETRIPSKYFPIHDITFTLSKKLYINCRKKRTIQYPNGQTFDGECKGGFRDGYGKMLWPDGCSYEGNWSFGFPEGYGKFLYHDNEHFEGKWVNPFPQCNDSLTSSTKSFDASSLFIDGFGKSHSAWLHFKQETTEAKTLSKPQSFEYIEKSIQLSGKILKQTKENLSRLENLLRFKEEVVKEGGRYQGDLLAKTRQGSGKMAWPNGNTYAGQWLGDHPHGYGVSRWPDGSQFIGFYKQYLKEGVGEYVWSNGNKYLGEWSEDTMNGVGTYLYRDGREYLGEWKNGNMEGLGKFVWKNGRVFEGSWKNGKKHGLGITVEPDGRMMRNVWNLGRITD